MSLSDEVRSRWVGWNRPIEGRKDFMYADARKWVTTGEGNLIDPITLALQLPWRTPEGDLATPEQIEDDWNRVKALAQTGGPRGLLAERYLSTSGLHLEQEDIDALIFRRLEQMDATCERRWPAWTSWPWQIQGAILLLVWACGSDAIEHHWPHLDAACDAEDWQRAKTEGVISPVSNPGVVPRNELVKLLFQQAIDQASS